MILTSIHSARSFFSPNLPPLQAMFSFSVVLSILAAAAAMASPDQLAAASAPQSLDIYHSAGSCLATPDDWIGEYENQTACFRACDEKLGTDLHAALLVNDGWCACQKNCDYWTTCWPEAEAAVVVGKTIPEPTGCRESFESAYEGQKSYSKNISIILSSSAIVSVAASILLIIIIFRSPKGTKITYNRLLLGMSISDIFYSLGMATFGVVVPSDQNYRQWNARGSHATCDAFGFMFALGVFMGLCYMCSLNLYYLALIRYNKTDSYIARKIERWLHAVPILIGLIGSIPVIAIGGAHSQNAGFCSGVPIIPPHCYGYEDGEIPDGFEEACRTGLFSILLGGIGALFTLFIPPIVIGSSLWMIYRRVSTNERRIARYGVGALNTSNLNRNQQTDTDAATSAAEGRNMSILRRIFRRGESRGRPNDQGTTQSRAVMHRAAAYSMGYFMTWVWTIVYFVVVGAGGDLPKQYFYVMVFFVPLQGLWTLVIYIHPNAGKAKRSADGNISWPRAFAVALRYALAGRSIPPRRRRNRTRGGPDAPGPPATPDAPRTDENAAPRAEGTPRTSATTTQGTGAERPAP